MQLTVSVAHRAGVTAVSVAGDLDIASRARLAAALQDRHRDGPHVVVDMRRVTFLDCAGLSTLLAAEAGLRAAGGSLRLGQVSRPVRRVLDLTATASVLMSHPAGDRHAGADVATVPPQRHDEGTPTAAT